MTKLNHIGRVQSHFLARVKQRSFKQNKQSPPQKVKFETLAVAINEKSESNQWTIMKETKKYSKRAKCEQQLLK